VSHPQLLPFLARAQAGPDRKRLLQAVVTADAVAAQAQEQGE
jgi:hypothetical protein